MPENEGEGAARRGNAATAQRQRNAEGVQLAQDSRASNAGIKEAVAKRLRHGERFASLHPCARYAYVDKLQCWLRTPLNTKERLTLQGQCGGKVFWQNERSRFDRTYVQRVQLNQPGQDAVAWATSREGLRINYVEIALDLVFDSEEELDAASDLISQLHWKKNHGKQEIRISNGVTRYSAARSAPNVFVVYSDRPCRVTGEIACAHLEWRMRSKALRKKSLSEIIEEGPRTFWQSRLIFREIDLKRLGHLYLNLQEGTQRHDPIPIIQRNRFVYDTESRTGGVLMRALGRSTQSTLDGFKFARPNQFTKALSADHLLPDTGQRWEGHTSSMIMRPIDINPS